MVDADALGEDGADEGRAVLETVVVVLLGWVAALALPVAAETARAFYSRNQFYDDPLALLMIGACRAAPVMAGVATLALVIVELNAPQLSGTRRARFRLTVLALWLAFALASAYLLTRPLAGSPRPATPLAPPG